jgi:Domain of unknown function (DUF4124)
MCKTSGMKDMIKISLLIVVFVFITGAKAQAEIYKWKDEKGKVHYGDKPVTSSEQMNINEESLTRKSISKSAREQRRNKLIETYDSERKEKKEQQAKAKKKKNKLNAQCGNAKDRLRRYKRASSLYDVDKDGNRTTLPDDVKQSAIARLHKQIKKHCR